MHPPLIVGAGPVGLAAALFLSHRDIPVRIIEAADRPHTQSRALAVNPRTIDLLEHTGVGAQILERGGRLKRAAFFVGARQLARVSFDGVDHPRPFMVALSQASTERLLEAALNARGVFVERSTKCTGARSDGDAAIADIESNGRTESVRCPWILGADGARSAVRAATGADFPGSQFPQTWRLADVPLRTDRTREEVAGTLYGRGGFLAAIPVVNDIRTDPTPGIWRLIGNGDDPMSRLKDLGAEAAGPPVWESSFRVSHRVAERFQTGRLFLAGDASHIHSPLGARGMNLGIEDAYVFAELAACAGLDRYDGARRDVDRSVVRRIERVTSTVAGGTLFSRLARTRLVPIVASIPPVRRAVTRTVLGLDHPVGVPG